MNWDQLKTIVWLRWRLTRNQWSRSGGIGAVVAVLVGIGAIVLGIASFAGALLGGAFGLREASPTTVLGIWFGLTIGFLFIWTIGLVNDLQRSETIDLQRLMHLPVALAQMFVVNYLVSHLALSIILVVPAMIGLTLGLAFARTPAMLLLAPLAMSFVFMVTAWTYCLRGWLSAMIANPRRRRSIIVAISFAFVLLAQAPNIYFNVIARHRHSQQKRAPGRTQQEARQQFIAAQKYIPLLWLPMGAHALAEGDPLPAILGTLGGVAIGALGLRRAYRSTVRFYRAETTGKTAAQIEPAPTENAFEPSVKKGSRFLELQIPALPEQAVALGLATFRSLLRAPEVKMAWATSFVATLIVGGSLLFRSPPKITEPVKPFIAAGAVTLTILLLAQFFANQFGFDRDGFRALMLSPAERRFILLGKNLACLPVGVGFGVTLLALISVWLHLPPLAFAAALFQLTTLLLLAGLVGNLLSILVPYRMQAGSMKPTKMPGGAMLVLLLCHLLFPLAMAPVFVPPLAELLWRTAGWSRLVPVSLALSAALAAVMAFVYWQTLEPMGRLLQRRETKILAIVSVEVE